MKPIEIRLAMRFRFQSKIEGNHQTLLYRGVHMQTHERLIMKGEQAKTSKIKKATLGVLQEGKIFQAMQGGIGIPYMHWCGQQDDFNFLVLDQMESSLGKLLTRSGGKFSLKTALMVGIQLVEIMQYCHFKSYVYNNINPRHIMLGKGQNYGKFYIIDMTRTSKFRDSINHDHINEPSDKTWEMRFFNMEFSSLNYQRGLPTTRRDDMQSLIYMVAYMIKGKLPWSSECKNMKKNQFQKCRYVVEAKTNIEDNFFKGYPQLQSLYNYTVSLKFDQKPQYAYYISTFNKILEKENLIDDKMFDWMFWEDDEAPCELNSRFDLYENEEEMIQKIGAEVEQKKSENIPSNENIKTPQSNFGNGRKGKGDKECLIY